MRLGGEGGSGETDEGEGENGEAGGSIFHDLKAPRSKICGYHLCGVGNRLTRRYAEWGGNTSKMGQFTGNAPLLLPK